MSLINDTPTRDDVLTAIVAGDRTQQHLAARFGIDMTPPFWSLPLWRQLLGLVCADLIYQQVVDGTWHYLPTKKGRTRATQQAIKAITDRRLDGR